MTTLGLGFRPRGSKAAQSSFEIQGINEVSICDFCRHPEPSGLFKAELECFIKKFCKRFYTVDVLANLRLRFYEGSKGRMDVEAVKASET